MGIFHMADGQHSSTPRTQALIEFLRDPKCDCSLCPFSLKDLDYISALKLCLWLTRRNLKVARRKMSERNKQMICDLSLSQIVPALLEMPDQKCLSPPRPGET